MKADTGSYVHNSNINKILNRATYFSLTYAEFPGKFHELNKHDKTDGNFLAGSKIIIITLYDTISAHIKVIDIIDSYWFYSMSTVGTYVSITSCF